MIKKALPYAAMTNTSSATILSVYILGGCDYVSGLYNITYGRLLEALIRYQKHIITKDDPLIKQQSAEGTAHTTGISSTAMTRLLCCVYLDKYRFLWKHLKPDPPTLFEAFGVAGNDMPQDMANLLLWLGYDATDEALGILTEEQWASFTRRIIYFSNHGSRDLYRNMLPSDTALELHIRRGKYILKCTMESTFSDSTTINQVEQYGWEIHDGKVEVKWDNNIHQLRKKLSSKRKPPGNKCTCQAGGSICTMEGRGCKNCAKACKPCTQ